MDKFISLWGNELDRLGVDRLHGRVLVSGTGLDRDGFTVRAALTGRLKQAEYDAIRQSLPPAASAPKKSSLNEANHDETFLCKRSCSAVSFRAATVGYGTG